MDRPRPDLARFTPNELEQIYRYVQTQYSLARTQILPPNNIDSYELPSEDFFQLISYIEHLILHRKEFFSFDTELNFSVSSTEQDSFDTSLKKMTTVIENIDFLLANMNDVDFLERARVLIESELRKIDGYLIKNDVFGDNPKFSKYRKLKNRLYNILHGSSTRISDLMSSSGFTVRITPYHENLDKACASILLAFTNVETQLKEKGIIFDERFVKVLIEGPSHERSHHEAYINYNPDHAESRRKMLINGTSGLGMWVHFTIELQIRRQGNKIIAGINTVIPHMGSLDEIIHVYLAPENPSLGDVLLTVKEIFRYLSPDSQLYQEVLTEIADICEEFGIFDEGIDIPKALIEGMSNLYYGEDFIKEKLIRNLRPVSDIFANHLVSIIKSRRNTES